MQRYLLLPAHLLNFWYVEGIETFVLTWKNLTLFLEEDLAVGLMVKLLFTPLFHDSSIVGRILSFFFRLGRIILGVFAFILGTLIVFGLAIFWLLLPVMAIYGTFGIVSKLALLVGIGLFLIHLFTHPHKKVWQVKDDNFWQASRIKKDNLTLERLTGDFQVKDILDHLEIKLESLPTLPAVAEDNKEAIGKRAFALAKLAGAVYLDADHFFVALILLTPNIEQALLKLDLKVEDFEQALLYIEKKNNLWRTVWLWDDDFAVHHLKGVNRGWLGVITPNLDFYSEDLTQIAAKAGFPEFISDSDMVSQVVNILSQEVARNVIIVGPPGSGKTSLIRHLANLIVAGDAPPALATKRLVALDLTKLISGIKTQGDLAERIKTVFEEAQLSQNIIMVIEEFHNLGLGEIGTNFNLYSLMMPYLESESFQFLATTETENYSRIIEKNGAFARLFTKIELDQTSPKETLKILESLAIGLEKRKKARISFIALKAAIELSQKLIHDRVLPDSAITTLEQAEAEASNGWITKETIQHVLSERVKMPIADIGKSNDSKLLNLEEQLHKHLIDQFQAVKVVADSLRRSATGLREENRPIGSFLFVGPTGVGKTELAKTLAEVYFKERAAFIRFDMSEYQNPESVAKLIGNPGDIGELTEAVKNRPYSLLLLDEFEKAHPKILTLFLQVLDDGRLTDGTGKTVDFTDTIIVATSNAASITIAEALGQGKRLEQVDQQVNAELLETFKPELINRFDDVVIFKPLSKEDLQKVVLLKLALLQKQLNNKGFLVNFDDDLVKALAEKGFDPVLGARPLRRLIQDTLEANLSRLILENRLPKGEVFWATAELLQ